MPANIAESYWVSRGIEQGVEDELAQCARALLNGNQGQWDWKHSGVWTYLAPAGVQLPPQGWKLHISATSRNAEEIIGIVMPILLREGVPFKFAANRKQMAMLNSSDTPRQTAGKFITIYPRDDAQAVRLAQACDQATKGLHGPAILSDRALRPGSLVHYRYGAFAGGSIFDKDGQIVPVIHDAQGEPVPDERKAWFEPPAWATNPFVTTTATGAAGNGTTGAAGNGARPPERSGRASGVLLNGRYVVRQALKHSNKGGVYLAEDRVTGVTAVIKEARAHVEAWGRGGDIADVMRHEARLLGAVAHLGLTPSILDLFEQQGHLFLVLELVQGDVLRDYVAGRHEETGQGLSHLELTSMIRQLAEMMDALHGAGVLLRDFTPNNLMVLPSGDLRLIDLELAHLLSDGPPLSWGAATPGFASPEQLAAQPSTFSDDYYALGATIAYMATASVPYLVPDRGQPRPLSERLRDWIAGAESDGAVAARVCDLVLGCMADDPSQRWGPREVLAAMEQPRPSICRHEVATVSGAELAGAVEDMGRWLARTIDPSGQRLWPTTCLGQADDPINVQSGAGGVGLFLCRAIETGGDPALRDLVATTSRWVSAVVSAEPNRPQGLYFGLAGATRFLGEAARCLDDPALAEQATTFALSLPTATFVPDITHGTAGIGLTQLDHWTRMGDARFLERAEASARALVAGAHNGTNGVVWPVADETGSRFAGGIFYGFAHGNAGIAYFLLAAAEALHEASYRDLALEGLETLMGLAQIRNGSATWDAAEGKSAPWPHWCNGSSGVGTTLIRAWAVTGDERYRHMAELAAEGALREKWRSSLIQCHGLAGNAEFLLDMHDLTGEPRFRDLALELAATIYRRRVYQDGLSVFADESGKAITASFNTGMTGIGWLFLRILHGGPRPLMVDQVLLRPREEARS